jgi:hypothetical protein
LATDSWLLLDLLSVRSALLPRTTQGPAGFSANLQAADGILREGYGGDGEPGGGSGGRAAVHTAGRRQGRLAALLSCPQRVLLVVDLQPGDPAATQYRSKKAEHGPDYEQPPGACAGEAVNEAGGSGGLEGGAPAGRMVAVVDVANSGQWVVMSELELEAAVLGGAAAAERVPAQPAQPLSQPAQPLSQPEQPQQPEPSSPQPPGSRDARASTVNTSRLPAISAAEVWALSAQALVQSYGLPGMSAGGGGGDGALGRLALQHEFANLLADICTSAAGGGGGGGGAGGGRELREFERVSSAWIHEYGGSPDFVPA